METIETLFMDASKMKLRISTKKGDLTVEDLWDLPLTSKNGVSLDDIAKALNKEVKESEEESFVLPAKVSNVKKDAKIGFDIVLKIIRVKQDELEEKRLSKEKKVQKEKLMALIMRKEDEALENLDVNVLKEMIAKL